MDRSDWPDAPAAAASGAVLQLPVRAAALPILALDLGTQTGWAMRDRNGLITSGSQSFHPRRFDGGGMRFLRFKRWLDEMKGAGLEAIYFEEVRRHMGVDAAHCYGGFMATLTAWCETEKIPYEGVPVGAIKKDFTGKGNADKPAMIARAVALGHAPTDDNEADAIALVRLVAKRDR